MELAALAVLVASLLLTLDADVSWASEWSYEGEKGPHYWHELFPQACSGKYQSPIDIRPEQTMYNADLKDFAIWYDPPRPGSTMTVLNNGHTVQVTTTGDFFVTNGGLPYVYKTAQFHFHWGHAKHHGSEHLIDSKAFPLELHIVNYNSDLYEDISQAVTEKQGLAVLGVLFEITDEDNTDLEPVIAAMSKVQDPEDRNQVEIKPLSLRSLLPDDISQYYRYNGSLTTPGCFESVVWTVFAQPKHISHRQMRLFREMLQMRHRHGGHHSRHRRSVDYYSWRPVSRRVRRRERRALRVLDELALTPGQQARFRRELAEKKHHAEEYAAKLDEQNAGETHHRTLEAVHKEARLHEGGGSSAEEVEVVLSEVEIEYIQDKLVNNFRPVQPLNDRIVYRSFKLRDSGAEQRHRHAESDGRVSNEEILRERLKLYESTDSAAPRLVSPLALLVSAFLAALFL